MQSIVNEVIRSGQLIGRPDHPQCAHRPEMYATSIFELWRVLTLSPAISLRLYTLPYWSNHAPFVIFDSARSPECQKLQLVG